MLIDPLPKYGASGPDGAFRLIDGPSNGRTVRRADSALVDIVGAHTATLTISHSVSKENGAVPTNRSAVRLEIKKVTSEGKSVIAHVTVVAAFPAAEFTVAEMKAIWIAIGEHLRQDSEGKFQSESGFDASTAAFSRIIQGEP